MKTSYECKNEAITGMSDDAFYGRESALNVDLDACRRAAIQEAKAGFDLIVHGQAKLGTLRIQIARVKLAIVLGNESRAMDYLGYTELPAHWLGGTADKGTFESDRAEFAKAVNRQHRHPTLAAKLADLENQGRNR